jgi:hypothetical protein
MLERAASWCVKRSTLSSEQLHGWAERSGYATPFVTDPAKCSLVVGTIDFAGFDRTCRLWRRRRRTRRPSGRDRRALECIAGLGHRASRGADPDHGRRRQLRHGAVRAICVRRNQELKGAPARR